MNKNLFMLLLALFPVILCSCYNLRTDVNQSADEATFWEKTQRTFFFAHDCRQSPEECTAICRQDRKILEKHHIKNTEGWSDFKFAIERLPRITCGISAFDKMNYLFASLAEQFGEDIVSNLIEHENDIIAYNTFVNDKDSIRRSMGLSEEEAIATTWKLWEKMYGGYHCGRLKSAIPFVKRMQADAQFTQALDKVLWTIWWISPMEAMEATYVILLVASPDNWRMASGNFRRGQTEQMAAMIVRSIQLTAGAIQTTIEFSKVLWGLYFLEELREDRAEERERIECVLAGIQTRVF